jgi:endoglycosylceramidase
MVAAVVAMAGIVAMVAVDSAGVAPGAATALAAPAAAVTDVVELRPLTTSTDQRIVDDLGRDVLLRGANVNSLGEYWQGVPTLPTTIAVTDADWAAMAANGMSVVRLLVTWSRIEPQRGQIDQAYLDLVDEHVRAAARHGIYSIIDMHQDAYSAFVATTDPATCPPGTQPGKGWDGAPEWATITDGASTCTTGDRYAAPAVSAAFTNFYENQDGIRDRFVATWGAVSARFAGRPEVAGFDFLNEPPATMPAAQLEPLYDALLADGVAAIRTAETAAGAPFRHLIVVEPAVGFADPSLGIVIPDPARLGLSPEGFVAGPHNYAESIGLGGLDVSVEQLNQIYVDLATARGVPTWIGEYGYWNTEHTTLETIRRHARSDDALRLGGAWWQWRQSCGDPHAVEWNQGAVVAPGGTSVQLNLLGCPANTDLGPNDAFLDVLGRAYPRATPGRLHTLASDPDTEQLDVVATATAGDVGQQLVAWIPDDQPLQLRAENLTGLAATAVPGGHLVTATVSTEGCYALHNASTWVSCAPLPTGTDGPVTPVPLAPVPVGVTRPAFTG